MSPRPRTPAIDEIIERLDKEIGRAALVRSAATDSEQRAEGLATDLKHVRRAAEISERNLTGMRAELMRAQTPPPQGGRKRAQTSDEQEREILRLHDEERLDRRAIVKYLRAFRPDLMRVSGTKSGLLTEKIVRRLLEDHKRAQTSEAVGPNPSARERP